MQNRLQVNIGPAMMPDFVTGAFFYSVLAWPTADACDVSAFHRVSEELIAGVVRLTNAGDPRGMRLVKNQYRWLNWPSIEAKAAKPKSAFGYLRKRLRQRMAAARAGIGKTHDQIFGKPAALPPGMTAFSIDQLCKLIKKDVTIDDPENIEKFVWRPSLPILHLAMAVQLMLVARDQNKDHAAFGIDLQDIDFYREAVRIAAILAEIVHEHPGIAITHDRLTLIRWVE